MFFFPRIRLKPLASLCRRLAFATGAGIEDRKIWRDEAARSRGRQQAVLQQVSESLARGQSIGDALAGVDDYLPRMFKQIAAIGDTSGRLDHAYRRLAEHYEYAVAARRSLMTALVWPMLQLGVAVLVIGVVIWISGALGLQNVTGEQLDLFGLGLVGSRGLALYVSFVTLTAIAAMLAIEASRRDQPWIRRLQRGALSLPAIGGAVQTLAMANFTWALHLVLDTPLDLRRALPLALDAAGNDYYRRLGPQVAENIQRGMSLHMALADAGAFPGDLLDAVAVGEQTGMLAETMERLSVEYQRRAAAAINVIAQTIGYVVWAIVAVLIIVLIFRVFSSYVGVLNSVAGSGAI